MENSIKSQLKFLHIAIVAVLLLTIGGSSTLWFLNKEKKVNFLFHYLKDNLVHLDDRDAKNQDKNGVYYLTGEITSRHPLADSNFLQAIDALAIFRNVEMLQWSEVSNEKPEYFLTWSKDWINYGDFQERHTHINPEIPLLTAQFFNKESYLGAYNAREVIRWYQDHVEPLDQIENLLRIKDSELPMVLRGMHRRVDGGFLYFEKVPGESNLGDLRISWTIIQPGIYSLITSKQLDVLVKIHAPDNRYLAIVKKGTHEPQELLESFKVVTKFWDLLLH